MGSANLPDARISTELYTALRRALASEPAVTELTTLLGALYGPRNAISGVQSFPVADCDITVGAEAANVIRVTIVTRDGMGNAPVEPVYLNAYLSTDSLGRTASSDPGEFDIVSTTGYIIKEFTTDAHALLLSTNTGTITIDVTHTGTTDQYFNVVMPNGKQVTSAVLDFS